MRNNKTVDMPASKGLALRGDKKSPSPRKYYLKMLDERHGVLKQLQELPNAEHLNACDTCPAENFCSHSLVAASIGYIIAKCDVKKQLYGVEN